MTWYRVSLLCFIGVALAACTKVEQGVLEPSPARAALRYVNLVPDTGAVDFRIIDIIGDAPVSGAASFRTGGQPGGNATNFLPPHFPVVAGERHIRVFPNSTDPAVASIILLDTTLTFAENVYYTFYLYRGSPRMQALVTVDTLPAPAGVAFRVINLGGTAVGNADVDIVAQSATVPLAAATATFANVAPGAITAYTNLAVSTSYRGLLSAPAARSTFLASTYAPAGAVGTATVNPVAGTAVAGTAISAVIVPPSVTGTPAPQTGNPTLRSSSRPASPSPPRTASRPGCSIRPTRSGPVTRVSIRSSGSGASRMWRRRPSGSRTALRPATRPTWPARRSPSTTGGTL
jgi:hypothetical protein